MGRVHERPVGPHPDWSCQLAFAPEVFGELVPWLAIHRQDLV
ncbi:DOPA 4,5-dioxygenase family protein, partial [Escherichia coli]